MKIPRFLPSLFRLRRQYSQESLYFCMENAGIKLA